MRNGHSTCGSDGDGSTSYATADETNLSDSLSGRSVDEGRISMFIASKNQPIELLVSNRYVS